MMFKSPFYKKGLQFECQKDCARCCGGSPGYVFLKDGELENIVEHMGIEPEAFIQNYTKSVDDRISLRDLENENWNCVMLKDGKCSIYNVRPMQCRTFPFWPHNIASKEDWEHLKNECPGIGKGKTFTMDEIEDISDGTRTVDSVK